MSDVFVGLGSNIGNRKQYLRDAINYIDAHSQNNIIKISKFRETEAVTSDKQAAYINAVILVETQQDIMSFFEQLCQIEKLLGRVEKGTIQPRTIDLDILFFGRQIICEESLIIPHPLLHEREFVLSPLNDIAPQFSHPIFQETVEALYRRVVTS